MVSDADDVLKCVRARNGEVGIAPERVRDLSNGVLGGCDVTLRLRLNTAHEVVGRLLQPSQYLHKRVYVWAATLRQAREGRGAQGQPASELPPAQPFLRAAPVHGFVEAFAVKVHCLILATLSPACNGGGFRCYTQTVFETSNEVQT